MAKTTLAGTAVVWATILCLSAGEARAVPPPKTDEELFEMSDIVVDAECIRISCEGPPVEDAEKVTTTYRSRLQVLQVYKGSPPGEFEILGQRIDWKGVPPVGGWHQEPVPEGFVGKFYLERVRDDEYTKVWWNAIQEDEAASHPESLPSCSGSDQDAGLTDAGPRLDAGLADGAPTADASRGSGLSDRGCGCRSGSAPEPTFLVLGLIFAWAWRLHLRRR